MSCGSNSVDFLTSLKIALEQADKQVLNIYHIAVVGKAANVERFSFETAEGIGYCGNQTELFCISLCMSTELMPLMHNQSINGLTFQTGEFLNKLNIHRKCQSKRQRKV